MKNMSWYRDRMRHSMAAKNGWRNRKFRQLAKHEIKEVILRSAIPPYSTVRDIETALSAVETYVENSKDK